jgi:glutamyl-tRNA synthetase
VNLLAMLGWNPGTEQEIFSLPELVAAFSLDKVGKAGAKFNPDKAKWFNREYLRMHSDADLAACWLPMLKEKGVDADPAYVERVVSLIKERATFVQDFWDIASYLFVAPKEFVPKDVDKFYKPEFYDMALEALTNSEADTLEEYVRAHEMPMGKVMNCLRLALTGSASGLGITDILHCIGKEEGLARLRFMKEYLG